MDLARHNVGIPTDAEYAALDTSARRKNLAQASIGRVLSEIEDEEREPDRWEAADLALALGLIASGRYSAALAYAERATTPPEWRGPSTTLDDVSMPGLRELLHGLEEVAGMKPVDFR